MNTTGDTTVQDDSDEQQEVILATGSYDHTIKFWQANTGSCIRTLQHSESVCHFIYLLQ